MSHNYRYKPASQQEVILYCLVGEALCAVQHVEDALSHSIVMNKTSPSQKKEAYILLDKRRTYTLGKVIKIAMQENLFLET